MYLLMECFLSLFRFLLMWPYTSESDEVFLLLFKHANLKTVSAFDIPLFPPSFPGIPLYIG